eukprot:11698805-Heterocapsa_arctica.AAC.1
MPAGWSLALTAGGAADQMGRDARVTLVEPAAEPRSRKGYPNACLNDGLAMHYLDDDFPMDSMLNATL